MSCEALARIPVSCQNSAMCVRPFPPLENARTVVQAWADAEKRMHSQAHRVEGAPRLHVSCGEMMMVVVVVVVVVMMMMMGGRERERVRERERKVHTITH